MRDLRAMVSPFTEVTVLAGARGVTSRAGLADRHTSTDEPEGSPARPAADGADARTRRYGEAGCVRGEVCGPPSPLSRLSDQRSLEENRDAANCRVFAANYWSAISRHNIQAT